MTKKFFCSLLLIVVLASPAAPQSQFNTKAFCKDLVKLWLKDWVALIAHELGHALVAKAFTNSPVNIHLGQLLGYLPSRIPIDKANLFRVGRPPITVHTFLPIGGWAEWYPSNSRFKNILISLAGPLCGALTYYLFNLYSTYQKFKKNKIPWTVKKLFKRSLFDADIYTHLITNLFPVFGNDGSKILNEFYPEADTQNQLYVAAAGVIICLMIYDGVFAKLQKKHYNDSLFLDKENIKIGNRFLSLFTHKLLAAIKYWRNIEYDTENFSIIDDTTFNATDVVGLLHMLFYKQYFRSLKNVYETS